MPRKSTKGAQAHPDGPLISLTSEQRKAIAIARLGKNLEQKQLAEKIGVSNATISNIEGGRSKQVRKAIYLKILKALRIDDVPAASSEIFGETVDLLVGLKPDDLQTVRDLAAGLANRSRKPA